MRMDTTDVFISQHNDPRFVAVAVYYYGFDSE